jgi:hypothetical protein
MLLEGAGPLGRIARDEVGMSADMIRTDAPSAAGLIRGGRRRIPDEAEKVKHLYGAWWAAGNII